MTRLNRRDLLQAVALAGLADAATLRSAVAASQEVGRPAAHSADGPDDTSA